MTALTPFQYGVHAVRTLVIDGEPAFIANDLCAVLELTNPRQALAGLDADEKGATTADTLGGAQQISYVTEAGMYSLVKRPGFRSDPTEGESEHAQEVQPRAA